MDRGFLEEELGGKVPEEVERLIKKLGHIIKGIFCSFQLMLCGKLYHLCYERMYEIMLCVLNTIIHTYIGPILELVCICNIVL